MNHEGPEARIFRRDRLDAVNHLRRRSAKPGLLRNTIFQRGRARRRARRAPDAAMLVRIADEAERREPLETLVMCGLEVPHRLFAAAGQIDTGAPNHVLAQLFVATMLETGHVIGANHIVENFLPVERYHRVQTKLRHQLYGLAARDRHPDLHRKMFWPRHHRNILKAVTAIIDRWGAFVVLALEVEGLLVETGQQQPKLLLEQIAVLLGVNERRAECLDLARVISASPSHEDSAVRHDVGHRIILCQSNGMPHRQNIESTTKLQSLGLGGKPKAELDQIWKDFVALALKMMLGRPQHFEAELIHKLGDIARGEKRLTQLPIGISSIVRRCAIAPDVVDLNLPDVKDMERLDHGFLPTGMASAADFKFLQRLQPPR